MAFENMLLGRISGPKRDEVMGSLRKVNDEELHNLYSSRNTTSVTKSRTRCSKRHVSHEGDDTYYYFLVRKPEGKRPDRRPRCRWEDNIKMYLKEVVFLSVNWIRLHQERDRWWVLVNMVINPWFRKWLKCFDYLSVDFYWHLRKDSAPRSYNSS
jgi:hypothetical protein